MDTLLAWLLMFAAAAIIVLGILLLAAERELQESRKRNSDAIIGSAPWLPSYHVGPPRLKAPKRIHRRN